MQNLQNIWMEDSQFNRFVKSMKTILKLLLKNQITKSHSLKKFSDKRLPKAPKISWDGKG